MNQNNKNSSPASDRVIHELVINGGKYLVAALNILLQASYQLGYFPKPWKNKKRIYLKKPGTSSYHVPSSFRSISLTNTFGKNFGRVIPQEAVNTLAQSNFFDGKNVYASQKTKTLPKPYFFL